MVWHALRRQIDSRRRMTDSTQNHTDDALDPDRREWLQEAEAALDRTKEALQSAWDATRDTRLSSLESAKRAAKELGEVIDRGVAVAKERWETSRDETGEPTSETSSQESDAEVTEGD
jgi:hypothetical protein